jgi:hypothetical protein
MEVTESARYRQAQDGSLRMVTPERVRLVSEWNPVEEES